LKFWRDGSKYQRCWLSFDKDEFLDSIVDLGKGKVIAFQIINNGVTMLYVITIHFISVILNVVNLIYWHF